jgi:hypothetical protein
VSKKGESVSFRNASNGRIEPFWSSIHAFSSKHIHITLADFMDQAPWRGTKTHSPLCIIKKRVNYRLTPTHHVPGGFTFASPRNSGAPDYDDPSEQEITRYRNAQGWVKRGDRHSPPLVFRTFPLLYKNNPDF